MECPKDGHPMEQVQFGPVTVDRCSYCYGIWFDMGEAEKLKKLDSSDEIDIGDPKVGRQFNKIDRIDCPRCGKGVSMLRMVDPAQPHIWLESCPSCYGIWLDAGEFKDYRNEDLISWIRDLFSKERK